MSVKILVTAFEKSGKSTITSKLRNSLVFNFDAKEYGFKVLHSNMKNYEGMQAIIKLMSEKIKAFKEKTGKLPENVVIDTVTQMYSAMQLYNANRFKGFDIHTANTRDTLEFNEFIEKQLIPNGMNVIIVAHTKYDESTGRHVIPAAGSFKDAGSWLSVVNDGIFVEHKNGKLIVHLKTMKFPCRTTLEELPEFVPIEDYSLQDHIDKLVASKVEAEDLEI